MVGFVAKLNIVMLFSRCIYYSIHGVQATLHTVVCLDVQGLIINFILNFRDIMSDNIGSGINVTDKLESNIKIEVNDVDVEVTGNTSAMTPLPADRNESHINHLQVPTKTVSVDRKQDIQINTRTERSASIPSMTSFLGEVLTPKGVTKIIKLRLMATLTITIFIVLLLFLTPVVFYNVNPPTKELYSFDEVAFDDIDFETCSVSCGCHPIFIIKQKCLCVHVCVCLFVGLFGFCFTQCYT